MWSPAAAAHLLPGSSCCAFLGWNERLFEFLLPSHHLEPVGSFSSDLSHQQGIFTGYVLFFGPFSVNPEMVVGVNPSRSAVSDTLRPARLAPTAMPRSVT